jgi:hypothetical protein
VGEGSEYRDLSLKSLFLGFVLLIPAKHLNYCNHCHDEDNNREGHHNNIHRFPSFEQIFMDYMNTLACIPEFVNSRCTFLLQGIRSGIVSSLNAVASETPVIS